MTWIRLKLLCLAIILTLSARVSSAQELLAGVAKVDITDYQSGAVHDPSYAKVLFLKQGDLQVVLVTLDAVSLGEIGYIGKGFLSGLRKQMLDELGLDPESIVVNTSHCHGRIRGDVQALVAEAIKTASRTLVKVTAGVGIGKENRISENRRVRLKDGSESDMRRAYPLVPDHEIVSSGPIDPDIGILKLNRKDGSPFAVIYQFACHPIMNPPSKGSSADFPAEASRVIEGATGAMAFFLQGCGGDINPIHYKEPLLLPDAAPLGAMLGSSVLIAAKDITTSPNPKLGIINKKILLPRAADYAHRITRIEAEIQRLVASLQYTNLNFKNFLPLYLQQQISPEMPSYLATGYLKNREDLQKLDDDNKKAVQAYLANVRIMEQITRLQANLSLLQKHKKSTEALSTNQIEVELCALQIGNFKWITFPGELTVEIGLNLKEDLKDPYTFISGYTNGYIFYAATESQRNNQGFAQEDCDALIAPEWQKIFEAKAKEMFQSLQP